ncbi:MAG TPA: GerMN domain-containing protein [Caldisericia bacterium]|jgi:hypothetical protein|nr:GerMN domain-containing protein [Caldisericia bacterium]
MLFLKQILLSILLIGALSLSACNTTPSSNTDPDQGSVTPPVVSEENPSSPATQETYQLFFNNIKKDPQMLDCEKVYPVTRNFKLRLNYEEVLLALLNGPTEAEKEEGFVPPSIRSYAINYVILSGDTAKIDFKILEISGSCAVGSLRAQLTETFKQFPGITKVSITLLGQSEGILEP